MTLKMILGKDYYNSTKKNICYRKLCGHVNLKEIFKFNSHGRIVLYYSPQKEYIMIIKKNRVHYVDGVIQTGINSMTFKKNFKLNDDKWIKIKETVFSNEIEQAL